MSNNISGGGRSRNAMSSVDFYRRVPKDLTEVSFRTQIMIDIVLRPFKKTVYLTNRSPPSTTTTATYLLPYLNIIIVYSGNDIGCGYVIVCVGYYGCPIL